MLNNIKKQADDPILQLSQLCRADQRADKIDVGVGIFINEQGETPVMRAVKTAEERLWAKQETKKYLPISGNPEFNENITTLLLGENFDKTRIRCNQAAGGTGALRVIGETVKKIASDTVLHVPDPTWGNHLAVFGLEGAGLELKAYPYLDGDTSEVARAAFFEYIARLGEGDALLLHGCCHNPSGADFTQEDWRKIAKLASEKGFLPIIDTAYLGLGESLEEDAWGVRHMVSVVPQALIALSCSKNFGLYRERCGAIISLAQNSNEADALQSQINAETRKLISMPPDHPAATVAMILGDEALRRDWQEELTEMCDFIRSRREKLQKALQEVGCDWQFITRHHGMFSLLPLGKARVERLREEFAIYAVGTGRINLAGLRNDEMIAHFAKSIGKVL